MGKKYMRVLEDVIDSSNLIYAYDNQGIGGFMRLASLLEGMEKEDVLKYLDPKVKKKFSKEYIENL